MVPTWCAWCTGIPEWAPVDDGDDGDVIAVAPAPRVDACTMCGRDVPAGDDREYTSRKRVVCWRCTY
jgi:hypothetical protein